MNIKIQNKTIQRNACSPSYRSFLYTVSARRAGRIIIEARRGARQLASSEALGGAGSWSEVGAVTFLLHGKNKIKGTSIEKLYNMWANTSGIIQK